MKPRDLIDLFILAAVWGGSFLFMRIGVAQFGPVALAGVRVFGATAVLLPLLMARGEAGALRRHWKPLLVIGITNSALPFLLFSYAALSITAGLSSIFNATTPLWGALVAWVWLKVVPDRGRLLGLAIGFAGVWWLASDKASFKADASGLNTGLAILACLVATLQYGYAANFTRRYLNGVPALALATGSQLSAAILLAIPTLLYWPPVMPGAMAWFSAIAIAVVCTGVAYVIYFRLIANVGAGNAVTVTFLIPAFAVLWGWMLLDETVSATMVIACAVIVVGTALVTGIVKPVWLIARPTDARSD